MVPEYEPSSACYAIRCLPLSMGAEFQQWSVVWNVGGVMLIGDSGMFEVRCVKSQSWL